MPKRSDSDGNHTIILVGCGAEFQESAKQQFPEPLEKVKSLNRSVWHLFWYYQPDYKEIYSWVGQILVGALFFVLRATTSLDVALWVIKLDDQKFMQTIVGVVVEDGR